MSHNTFPKSILIYLVLTLIILISVFIVEYHCLKYYFPTLTLVVIGFVLVVMSFLIYGKLVRNAEVRREDAEVR